jgi:hypothetical protein
MAQIEHSGANQDPGRSYACPNLVEFGLSFGRVRVEFNVGAVLGAA